MKQPKKYHQPVVTAAAPVAVASPCAHGDGGGRPSPASSAAAAAAAGAPAAPPTIVANLVKMEVLSDCEGDGHLAGGGTSAAAVVVDGGYSSSSTLDDTPYASEEEQQQCLASSSDRGVEFDGDDNAACDSLLRDILGQQDGSGDDDEFLSLLSDGDMMIVNPASEGLSEGFVKREPSDTNVVF